MTDSDSSATQGDSESSMGPETVDPVMCECQEPLSFCSYDDDECTPNSFDVSCNFPDLHDFLYQCPSLPVSPCGVIIEDCVENEFCDGDVELRTYTATSLECGIRQLRDRTPGTLTWESSLDFGYSGEIGAVQIRPDGKAFNHRCDFEDYSQIYARSRALELGSKEYFDGCLAQTELYLKWECMHNGITEGPVVPLCSS